MTERKEKEPAVAMSNSSEVIVLPRVRVRAQVRRRAKKGRRLPAVIRLLGQPPLVTGERVQDFEAFLLALSEDLKPGSLCEWLIVCEMAQLKWISARVRRAESGLIDWKLRDTKISSTEPRHLGYAFAERIDYVERTSYLIMEYEKRCDLLIRNLERKRASEARPKRSETIDLEAEEVGDV